MSRAVAIIPARLESTRLPNKALADILGLPMIAHVFKRCLLAKCLDAVYVATDNNKIRKVVEQYGGEVIMTSAEHQTGTDRIAEAAQDIEADIIVNVQGDEALANPEYIDKAVDGLVNSFGADVAILVNPFNKRNSPSDIKAVLNEHDEIMYLSREDIPSNARVNNPQMLKAYHIIPFRKDFLLQYAKWDKTELEQIEFNEYLRILEKGYKIQAVRVESDAVSVDTEQDLEFVRGKMKVDKISQLYL
jgi:3-deoxy-manno-octulosonate cytidylyltransferase (CMP-KDO synthetase)